MRYFKLAARFVKDNFFNLALTTLLPAVFMAFAHDPSLKFYSLLSLSELKGDFWDAVQGIALIADWRKMLHAFERLFKIDAEHALEIAAVLAL